VEEVKTALNIMRDDMQKEMEEVKTSVQAVQMKTSVLEKKVNEHMGHLKKTEEELSEARLEIEELKQYSRSNNVGIDGIPNSCPLDEYQVLEEIGKLYSISITKSDIDLTHRISSKRPGVPRPIIAKFTDRWKKLQLLEAIRIARKTTGSLTTSKLGIDGPQLNIYVSDHLTVYKKSLAKRARDLRRGGVASHVWVRDGKIFMRKEEGAEVLFVTDKLLKEFEAIKTYKESTLTVTLRFA